MWLLRDYESSTLPKSFDSTVRSQSTHLEKNESLAKKMARATAVRFCILQPQFSTGRTHNVHNLFFK